MAFSRGTTLNEPSCISVAVSTVHKIELHFSHAFFSNKLKQDAVLMPIVALEPIAHGLNSIQFPLLRLFLSCNWPNVVVPNNVLQQS